MSDQIITHIRHTNEEKKTTAWCGRRIGMVFAFVSIDHAAYSRMGGDRILPCKKCVAAIVKMLTKWPSPPQ